MKKLVYILLDASGSMVPHRKSSIDAIEEYLSGLKEDRDIVVSLTTFNSDDGVEPVFICRPIGSVREINWGVYSPMGMTPLYDSIETSISYAESEIQREGMVKTALFVIITDGLENCSKAYTKELIKDLIESKKRKEWTFVYIGADANAWVEASKIGVGARNTMRYVAGNEICMTSTLREGTQRHFAKGGQMETNSAFFDSSDPSSE